MDRLEEIDRQYVSGQWGADDEAYDDIQWLIAEVKRLRKEREEELAPRAEAYEGLLAEYERLRRELTRIRDGRLSYAAMQTVALEALLPPEERASAEAP